MNNNKKNINIKLFKKNPNITEVIKKYNKYNLKKSDDFSNFYQKNQSLIEKCITIQEELATIEKAQKLNKHRIHYRSNFVRKWSLFLGADFLGKASIIIGLAALVSLPLPLSISFLPLLLVGVSLTAIAIGSFPGFSVKRQQKEAEKEFVALFDSYPENTGRKSTIKFFEDKKEQLNKEIEALTQTQEKSLVSNQENEPTQSSCIRFFSARKDTVSEENNNLVIASSQKVYA